MSRKVENLPIARVSSYLVGIPSLSSGTHTADFAFESLRQPLHLTNSLPTHTFASDSNWYSGVEMEVAVQAVNLRFQIIRNATLYVSVTNNGSEILKSQTPVPVDIQPQRVISHVVKFRPAKSGDVVVRSTLKFTFESYNTEATNKKQFTIIPTFNIDTRTGSSETQKIEVKLRNDFPQAVTNVFLTGPNGEYMNISNRIEAGDIWLGIVKMNGISKDITINWDLPFSQKCLQKASITQAARCPVYPLSFEFIGAPKSIKCFKPFKVTVRITNHEKVPLSGKGEVQTVNQSIYPFGPNQFDIPSVIPNESKEVEIEFVGMVQGEFHLPPISIAIQHMPAFQINPSEGVLLVGTGDDE